MTTNRKTCRICMRQLHPTKTRKVGRPSDAHPKCRAVVAEHITGRKFTREAQLPGNAKKKWAKGEEFAEAVDAHSGPPDRRMPRWGDE